MPRSGIGRCPFDKLPDYSSGSSTEASLWAAGSAFQAMGEQSAGWVAGTDRREKVAGNKRELGAISVIKSGIM